MSNDEEQLFSQLAEDPDLAAAVAEHEAACELRQQNCPICLFFTHVHELRHLSEALDPEKIVNLAASTPDFLDDAMVIVGFLTEATRYFLADQIAWSEVEFEDEEEDDEDED